MNLFKRFKRMTEPKQLKEWQSKLDRAKSLFSDERNDLKTYQEYYKGTREVQQNPNLSKSPSKVASNVRNIVYELIESQVDSSIPMPKVRAIHEEDDELARKIERLLENKVVTCGLKALNDYMERTTPVEGADFFHIQWDANLGLHSEIGDVKVSEIHPRKLIPQPGVTQLEDMDYFFIQELFTKKAVKNAYGVDVSEAENDDEDIDTENTDLVTVTTAYYHNDKGGIGIYTWCDDIELLDIEEYQKRQLDHCSKCGATMQNGVCPVCGGKKSKKMPVDYEELVDTIEVTMDMGGRAAISPDYTEEIPILDEMGEPVYDEYGQPQMEIEHKKREIPYYSPNVYPVVMRRNISDTERFLGQSDVKIIMDQQDTIKKLGSKMNEKLLKGGSYVTLPQGVDVELTDKELKIIRLNTPAEKQLIDVINVQPNISYDLNYQETNYQWAKSALGITDSFQGKYDASATSGTAKQYQINQAAGRLESKRVLRNEAFAKLYEVMFKFWLAYADQATEVVSEDSNGQMEHFSLDRHEFLKMDASGELYWNDEFIFETDPTSTLLANREAMWNQTDLKLQSQAFGPLGDLKTLRTYWTFMKASGYPNAGLALDIVEQRIAEQEQQEQMIGGMTNEMSQMPM